MAHHGPKSAVSSPSETCAPSSQGHTLPSWERKRNVVTKGEWDEREREKEREKVKSSDGEMLDI